MLQGINELLGQEAERLRQIGVTVQVELLKGIPDEAVVAMPNP